jgi:ribosomal protein S18 acetylase RimI-like enzyme
MPGKKGIYSSYRSRNFSRNQGLGKKLAGRAVEALEKEGIHKAALVVLKKMKLLFQRKN